MRTNSRRRKQGLVLAAATVILSLPELAQAQQTGLFPTAPIKRQRVPCDQEDPIYKIYKHQYFGYHPTCWRKFPSGWGCPSKEAPNREQSFKDLPFLSGKDETTEPPPDDGQPPADGQRQPATRPALPNPPTNERSPFEMDKPEDAPAAPGGRQAPPAGRDDPFETPAAGSPRASRSPRGESPSTPANDSPALAPPADEAEPADEARSAHNADDRTEQAQGTEEGPLLALPSLNVPQVDEHASSPAAPSATPAPTPRKGLISGLFSNLGWNWTRR
jgi:hypothetical protein